MRAMTTGKVAASVDRLLTVGYVLVSVGAMITLVGAGLREYRSVFLYFSRCWVTLFIDALLNFPCAGSINATL